MSDYILNYSKYNINSFNEVTMEEYKDVVEISLCNRRRTLRDYLLVPRSNYYIKFKRVKANIEKIIDLSDMYDTDRQSIFENTCFYWYIRSVRDNDTYCSNELPYIYEADFNSGAYITDHTFNHIDNTFTFHIKYGRHYEFFANKIQTIIGKTLSINEIMDCFWLVTNETVTLNIHTRDINGNIIGFVELCKLNDTKSFFKITLYGLHMYLCNLTRVKY